MYSNIFNRISFFSLFLLVVLLPIFFLPLFNISVEISKNVFFVTGIVLSVLFWIISRFSEGKIDLPKSIVILAGIGVVIASLLSAVFSGALGASFFGAMMDVGTFWFILLAFTLMLMSAIVFREPKNARMVLFGIIISSIVLLVFQTLHLFFPKILSFGILPEKTSNILGSWNALGIFAGFFTVLSLFSIEFFQFSKRFKIILGVFLILALFLIAVINFTFVWEILGIFALIIFVYKVSVNTIAAKEGAKMQFPVFPFAVILLSLFFFMSSGIIGGLLPTKLGIVNNEVSPSFISTMSVTKSVLKADPIFGLGPNRFSDAWALYKPVAVNQTLFWDIAFNSGYGLLFTLAATTGILGILSWAVFLLLFVFSGIRWLFFSIKRNTSLETVSFFLLALYLFASAFFYFTGVVLFLLAFVFAGIFIGLISGSSKNGEISISFATDPRKSFFSMLFLIILMIVSAGLGFKYVERFVSVPYYTKTLAAPSVGDAEYTINKALALNANDLYLRTYSQVYLLKLNNLAAGTTTPTEEDKANLQSALDSSIAGATLAIKYNPRNYLNYQMLGSVYQSAGLIGVPEANVKALDAFKKASELNPANPRIKLLLATVSDSLGDAKNAKEYANQALTLKPDYIDALVSLSQLERKEGNLTKALSYAERALSLAPGNKDLINYANTLRGN